MKIRALVPLTLALCLVFTAVPAQASIDPIINSFTKAVTDLALQRELNEKDKWLLARWEGQMREALALYQSAPKDPDVQQAVLDMLKKICADINNTRAITNPAEAEYRSFLKSMQEDLQILQNMIQSEMQEQQLVQPEVQDSQGAYEVDKQLWYHELIDYVIRQQDMREMQEKNREDFEFYLEWRDAIIEQYLDSVIQQQDLQEIVDLLLTGPAKPPTRLDTLNLNTVALGDNMQKYAGNAGIEGNLARPGGAGTYSFNVNLFSGAISSGAMRGMDAGGLTNIYDLNGGTGLVRGNNFNVSNFQGTFIPTLGGITYTDVGSGTLSGTASKGFKSLGDIGASGSFAVRSTPGTISGTIVDGRRVR